MKDFEKITEAASRYEHLERMSVKELIEGINQEDKTVAEAVEEVLPRLEKLIVNVEKKLRNGGRLFYIGAGTSGRLGILDASECPPTFGVPPHLVIGIIAGGDSAIRTAVEGAEDDKNQAWIDLEAHQISQKDFVIGIAASGTTPYVVGGLSACRNFGISTGCITCNPSSPITACSDFPIEVVVGPEFVTGSSRMKAGTAQKMILNMITTSVMIRLGHVRGNKMVDMQLSNAKLVERGVRLIREEMDIPKELAQKYLLKFGSVRTVLEHLKK